MKNLKNILFILALSTALFSCHKEIIKPVDNVENTERAGKESDSDTELIERDVTDPDDDEDFEGIGTN
jgi:hypothetical protein